MEEIQSQRNINLTDEEADLLKSILLKVRDGLSIDESMEYGWIMTDILSKLEI